MQEIDRDRHILYAAVLSIIHNYEAVSVVKV